jgi:hypothetical protein
MGPWATVDDPHCSSSATVMVGTVAYIVLGFDFLGVKSSLCIYKQWRTVGVSHRLFRVNFDLLYPLPHWCVVARRRCTDEGQDHYDHFVFSYPIQQFISAIYSPQSCR